MRGAGASCDGGGIIAAIPISTSTVYRQLRAKLVCLGMFLNFVFDMRFLSVIHDYFTISGMESNTLFM